MNQADRTLLQSLLPTSEWQQMANQGANPGRSPAELLDGGSSLPRSAID